MFRKILTTLFLSVIFLIAGRGQKPDDPVISEPVPVFPIGEKPYNCYRIPAIITLPGKDLLAFAEGRKTNCADFGDVDIVMKRSRDGGKTWSGMTVIVDNGSLQAGNCAPVVDLTDPAYPGGRIFLFYNTGTASEQLVREGRGIREVWYVTSADQGVNWSKPVNITIQVHKPFQPSVDSAYTFREDWRAFANTPGHALQISSGRNQGRIYVAANHSAGPPLPEYADGHSFGYYTDDHGLTFRISDDVSLDGSNEATAAETDSGWIYLNARNQKGHPPCRIVTTSRDGGATWGMVYYDCMMPDPVCQGSVLNIHYQKRNILFFTNPATHTERKKLTLRISNDQGKTWTRSLLLVPGDAAYSDLSRIGDNTLGCLYEKGSDGGIYFLTLDYSSLMKGW